MSTATADRFSPRNPRPWSTAHLSLSEPAISAAPHETAGVLRMQRHGMRGPQIVEKVGMSGAVIESQMYKALGAEETANTAGRPIHDAAIDPARA
ncbi:hypothetical protein [Rhodococcus opacus]|uniref:hypothetical protein n=1 Tax=Rhodococcus opacus TaxID=37919 RepID=UPI001C45F79C|nr:hypothetical protein [Rhodococcus opacus]MBV6758377.1 hypothetical protein [Rhodococcus opacus]